MSRTASRRRTAPALRPLLLAAAVALLSACGGAARSPDVAAPDVAAPPGEPVRPAADGLVLRVEHVGGFVMPETLLTRLPSVSVYADGRVLGPGPQPMIWPGPALPPVGVTDVGREGAARLVQRAVDAGVGTAADLGQPPIADAPATRFTVVTDSGTLRTEVQALQEAGGEVRGPDGEPAPDGGSGLTDEQLAARAELADLLAALTDLPGTLGAGNVGAEAPYTPEALAVIAGPWAEPGAGTSDSGEPPQPEVAWPGPALPGEPIAPQLGLSCLTVTGADLAAVLDAAAGATAATPWTSGDTRWSLTFRPLLPDEEGCADLREQS